MGALYHVGARYALHVICTLHGYRICSRGTGGPTRRRVDTHSGIMDPGCFSAQRQVGMGLVGPNDRYVVIPVLALFYVVGVTCFACICRV